MYTITTHDPSRLTRWESIFGSDHLPVKTAVPRTVCEQTGDRLAYDLDLTRLPSAAVYRLAAYIARELEWSYTETLSMIQADGWRVCADGCELVQDNRPVPTFVLRIRQWWSNGRALLKNVLPFV